MPEEAADFGAISETVVFPSYFEDLKDPRQASKVSYPLNDVLLLCLLAVLGGAETITGIALFGKTKLALLRRFLPYRDGKGIGKLTRLAQGTDRIGIHEY